MPSNSPQPDLPLHRIRIKGTILPTSLYNLKRTLFEFCKRHCVSGHDNQDAQRTIVPGDRTQTSLKRKSLTFNHLSPVNNSTDKTHDTIDTTVPVGSQTPSTTRSMTDSASTPQCCNDFPTSGIDTAKTNSSSQSNIPPRPCLDPISLPSAATTKSDQQPSLPSTDPPTQELSSDSLSRSSLLRNLNDEEILQVVTLNEEESVICANRAKDVELWSSFF